VGRSSDGPTLAIVSQIREPAAERNQSPAQQAQMFPKARANAAPAVRLQATAAQRTATDTAIKVFPGKTRSHHP
jgi:hypothetical protein